jgi:hypothetical protein
VLIVEPEMVTPAEATQWYLDLAARLEAEGVTGKLTVAPHTPPPQWANDACRTGLLPRAHLGSRRSHRQISGDTTVRGQYVGRRNFGNEGLALTGSLSLHLGAAIADVRRSVLSGFLDQFGDRGYVPGVQPAT